MKQQVPQCWYWSRTNWRKSFWSFSQFHQHHQTDLLHRMRHTAWSLQFLVLPGRVLWSRLLSECPLAGKHPWQNRWVLGLGPMPTMSKVSCPVTKLKSFYDISWSKQIPMQLSLGSTKYQHIKYLKIKINETKHINQIPSFTSLEKWRAQSLNIIICMYWQGLSFTLN